MIEVPLGIIALCGPSIRLQLLRWYTQGFRSMWRKDNSHRRLIEPFSGPVRSGTREGFNLGKSEGDSDAKFPKVHVRSSECDESNISDDWTHESKDNELQPTRAGTDSPAEQIRYPGRLQV